MGKKPFLQEKSYVFAIRVVRMHRFLTEDIREFVLSKQLLRSGTAVGALICEAEFAESRADFIHKYKIALKEAGETRYWISLLKDTNYIDEKMYGSIIPDCEELIKLLISSIKKLKESNKKQ